MTKLAKSLAVVAALLLLLPLALIFLTITVLQFSSGRAVVSDLVSSIASTADLQIKLEGLYLAYDLDAGFDRVILADRDGVFSSAENFSLEWQPTALLGRRIDITSADIASVTVLRQPTLPAATDQTAATTTEDNNALSLPPSRIGSLTIGMLSLGKKLLGEDIQLSLNGGGSIDSDPMTLTGALEVFRKGPTVADGTSGGRISANVAFAPDAGTLAFTLDVEEPQGGLAARLLDVPGLPALNVALKGDGPLSDWAADLAVALDGRQTVSGTTRLTTDGVERQLTTNLQGDLSPLMPSSVAAFFLGNTDLEGSAHLSESFIPLDGALQLTTGTLNLTAKGDFNPQVNGLNATANLDVSAGGGNLIAVEIGDRRLQFGPLALQTQVSGQLTAADWSIELTGQSLGTNEGKLQNLALTAKGNGADFSPDVLESPLSAKLTLNGLAPTDRDLQELSGDSEITLTGRVNGVAQRLDIAEAIAMLPGIRVDLADSLISQQDLRIAATASADDLSRFAALAGKPLEGVAELALTARGAPASLNLAGTLQVAGSGVKVGVPQADALLAGETRLKSDFKLAGADNLELTELSATSEGFKLTGNAALKAQEISADLAGELSELSLLNPQVVGPLAFSATVGGSLTAAEVNLNLSSETITLAGSDLRNFDADIDATASATEPAATISMTGRLKDQPLNLSARLTSSDGGVVLDDLQADVAGNKLSGRFELADLSSAPQGLEGTLTIDAGDLASLSPLALRPLGGSLRGDIKVTAAEGLTTAADVELSATDLKIETLAIGSLSLNAKIDDPFAVPSINAKGTARDVLAGSAPFKTLTLTAQSSGRTTDFETHVALTDGANPDGVNLTGTVTLEDNGGITLALSDLDGRYQGIETDLSSPAQILYEGGKTSIEPITLALGNGRLTVSGSVADTLDLTADLKDVPLTLANAFAPDLGLSGILTGNANVKGPTSAPQVSWKAGIADLSAAQLRQNGLSALGVDSTGQLEGTVVTQTTKVFGPDGLVLTVSGQVRTGTQALDLALDGSLPLSFMRRPFTEAGLRAKGAMALSGQVKGTVTSPQYSLSATPSSVILTDLNTATTLQNFKGSFEVTQSGLSVSNVTADLAAGGSISANGSIGLDEGNSANLTVKANQARYVDPGVVNALFDVDVAVNGPLTGTSSAAEVSGDITIEKADITIPDSLPGTVSPVAVKHVNAPADVREQVKDIGGGPSKQKEQSTATLPPRLNINVSAPGQIFVRGRGLDAELYGNLRIVGTTNDPQAIGAFTLRRGQMDVLTRRLTFSKGEATFTGDFTPIISFLATTTVSSTAINVGITGPAGDPLISLTSSPDQPQDEILALLLFGEDMGSLSPTQIAQLAAAIATLTGGNDSGPLASLRKSLGLDAIDIDTSGEDGPTVGIGKYVNENIYLGVEQGTKEGSSRVKVDIDLDKGFKVRGEVGASGDSKAGIYFEKEY
ncbi:translocation/assembly module TamB domain-containing protein [Roseibium sp.]|uniref:translocation/assembly module TamB domain-containing protein n=1 Tax=Roseibium sp. TaxID=1936156 RepID=UPI003A97F795